jgi:hypothetical protein
LDQLCLSLITRRYHTLLIPINSWLLILNPKSLLGLIFATGEATMSKDRMLVTGFIGLSAISTALAVWVIFSI